MILEPKKSATVSTVALLQTICHEVMGLVLEKAEEPQIKLPTSAGSSKKQESSRKTYISALLTMPKCQGPAPVDPGNSKDGRCWRGKTCLFINIRLD